MDVDPHEQLVLLQSYFGTVVLSSSTSLSRRTVVPSIPPTVPTVLSLNRVRVNGTWRRACGHKVWVKNQDVTVTGYAPSR